MVRVRRTDGRPAAGAIVGVPRSTVPVPELALVADAGGIARLYLPAGYFTVEAFTQDGAKGCVEVAVAGDEAMHVDVLVEGGER
jgi:hypothetical protein